MKDLRALWALPGLIVFSAGLIGEEHPAKATVWQDAPHSLTIAAIQNLPTVASTIKRNPFDGVPATPSPAAAPNSGGTATAVVTPMPGTPLLGAGVPNPGANLNIGSTGDPSAVVAQGDVAATVYVISTVTGDGRPPLAMLKNGNDTDIVGVGDMIGRHRITRIVPQGIEFDDGSRLAVASSPSDGGQNSQQNPSGSNPYGNNTSGAQQAPEAPVAAPTPGPNTASTNSAGSSPSGPPVINPSPYTFGPLATPIPGTTPAPVPHFYPPPAGTQ
jgi:hypothetical protein